MRIELEKLRICNTIISNITENITFERRICSYGDCDWYIVVDGHLVKLSVESNLKLLYKIFNILHFQFQILKNFD